MRFLSPPLSLPFGPQFRIYIRNGKEYLRFRRIGRDRADGIAKPEPKGFKAESFRVKKTASIFRELQSVQPRDPHRPCGMQKVLVQISRCETSQNRNRRAARPTFARSYLLHPVDFPPCVCTISQISRIVARREPCVLDARHHLVRPIARVGVCLAVGDGPIVISPSFKQAMAQP